MREVELKAVVDDLAKRRKKIEDAGATLTFYGSGGFYLDGQAQVKGFNSTLNSTTAGLDVVTVSRRLGHGSPGITLAIYAHRFADTDKAAAQAMDAALRKG